MRITVLMPIRNEAWICGLSLRVALLWADDIVILDHASTDGSREIIDAVCREHPGRVWVIRETDEKWDEMRHRQAMLEVARTKFLREGIVRTNDIQEPVKSIISAATHIAIVDADEIVTANLIPTMIRDLIASTPAGSILSLPGYNLRGGLNRYHSNGVWGNRWFSFAFRDHPKLKWAGDRFHQREPLGLPLQQYRPIDQGQAGVMHLWGASERRLRAKHDWYKITEALRFPGKDRRDIERYYSLATKGDPRRSDFGTPATWTYADLPYSAWLAPYEHWSHHLHLDDEPWQAEAVRRAIEEHGAQRFEGLDLT